MNRIEAQSPYRNDIQGLRAIAVLLVIAEHAGVPGLHGGFIGVDVFFVISGFVITGGISRSLNSSGSLRFLDFYAARARRLLPALSAVLLATLAIGNFLLAPSEQKTLAATAAFQSVYASNLYFIQNATNYFAADASLNPLLHTWSLSVEEQFYLFWPLSLWLCFKWGGRRALLTGIVGLSLLSFALNLALVGQNQPLAFFGTPT